MTSYRSDSTLEKIESEIFQEWKPTTFIQDYQTLLRQGKSKDQIYQIFHHSPEHKQILPQKIQAYFQYLLHRDPLPEEIQHIEYQLFQLNLPFSSILYQILISYEYYQQATLPSTPFSIFRTSIERQMGFYRMVEKGKVCASEKSLIWVGLIRDNAKVIPLLQSRFYEIAKDWKEIRFLIVENNSVDGTRQLLLDWAKKDPRIEILGGPTINHPISTIQFPPTPSHKPVDETRIRKMAILRNLYVDAVRQRYPHFTYLCVTDLDIQGRLYVDGIYHSIGIMEEDGSMDAMGANGCLFYSNRPEESYQPNYTSFRMTYYDPFALVEKGKSIVYGDLGGKMIHDKLGVEYGKKLQVGQPPVPVTSAFAGCCIYRISSIMMRPKMKYDYSPGKFSCEHAHFNRHLSKMAINPSMIYFCLKH